MGLAHLPATASVEEAMAIISRDGGVIIDNLFTPETINGLTQDFAGPLNNVGVGEDPYFSGDKTRRLGALFRWSPKHMTTVASAPLYYEVAKKILCTPIECWLGEDKQVITPEMMIGVTQLIEIGPGQGAQPLHRDDMSFLWRHPQYGREGRCQIMVAVTDFTEENGATLVIPGSHKWDDHRAPKRSEAVSAVMSKGSALIWIGSTYHAGGQNTSNKSRIGLTMAYDLSNLRQEENMMLSLPLTTVRQLPPHIQRHLGWSSGTNYMGYIMVDGQFTDPMKLLEKPDYKTLDNGVPAKL